MALNNHAARFLLSRPGIKRQIYYYRSIKAGCAKGQKEIPIPNVTHKVFIIGYGGTWAALPETKPKREMEDTKRLHSVRLAHAR